MPGSRKRDFRVGKKIKSMATIKSAIINEYSQLTDAEVQQVVDALQVQVHRDFASVWGIDADLTFYKNGDVPPDDSWQLIILDNSDQAGALGYHDLTSNGLPLGKVFAGTDAQYHSSWSVTASHELLEMLGDPDINLTATKTNNDGTTVLYAYEDCDACEADEYGYEINGVLVSDFVYPAWFEQFHPAGTQYDFQNKITAAFQLLPGGYISVNYGNGWTQIYGQHTILAYKMRAHIGSRRERRSISRNNWLKSTAQKNKK